MQERLLKRSETSGRPDDNIETIQKRFATFVEKTLPVVGHYEELNKLSKVCVSSVSADHQCYVHKGQFVVLQENASLFLGSDKEAEKREPGNKVEENETTV